ncbi:MAG TPA: hypothetical protein VKA70_06725 [Blastocatellia bacterium]|nr:hypothetical protein [Blastocatellia bacterium]
MRKSLSTVIALTTLLAVSIAVFAIHPSSSSSASMPAGPVQTFCSTPLQSVCSDREQFDFPSIPARSTAEMTATRIGVDQLDEVIATPLGAPEAGLLWTAYVSDVDTVTLRLANVTVNAINPVERKYRITVNKYNN